MTDELKPSPEAVQVAKEIADRTDYKPNSDNYARVYQGAYFAAALVIDRALRPATMPGDVVEAINPDWHYIDLFRLMRTADRSDNAKARAAAAYTAQEVQIALTAMQPAIQAAVDALEKIKALGLRNEQFSSDRAVWAKMASIAGDSLTTLRTVTKQGEG